MYMCSNYNVTYFVLFVLFWLLVKIILEITVLISYYFILETIPNFRSSLKSLAFPPLNSVFLDLPASLSPSFAFPPFLFFPLFYSSISKSTFLVDSRWNYAEKPKHEIRQGSISITFLHATMLSMETLYKWLIRVGS